mgnify:CR=1 FL=1
MQHLHPIKNQASPYWDSLVRIYLQSFPIDEQRPVESIARLLNEEPRYTMYSIVDDNYAAELQSAGHWPLAIGSRDDENCTAELQTQSQQAIANSPKALGLLTTWEFDDFIYIEHFAINPSLRSQGYGSEALKAFIHEQGKPLVLEAEPPADEMTHRRIRFYERIDLTLYDYPYIQPAYTEESLPVELRLMGTIDTETIPLDKVSDTLHREVYGCK